ncbi:hypothetical protein [Halarchaeum acidiphilum]|uniref:hypothetical protein n=1 Tax=Halarchaeum acidiphilum TaxID=489138 RepID=UPI0011D1CB3D|nr:hypothetical protein [Halarchaeum acidiphilum]
MGGLNLEDIVLREGITTDICRLRDVRFVLGSERPMHPVERHAPDRPARFEVIGSREKVVLVDYLSHEIDAASIQDEKDIPVFLQIGVPGLYISSTNVRLTPVKPYWPVF